MKAPNALSIVRAILIAGIVVVSSFTWVKSAAAQNGTAIAIVNIPFDFQTSMQKMPAGLYRIERGPAVGMVTLRGPDRPVAVLAHIVIGSKAPSRGRVTFNRIGNLHFLDEIWSEGANEGLACFPGHVQKEQLKLAKRQAPGQITLALSHPPSR